MRKTLMIVCAALWLIAGFNVVRMGVAALGLSTMSPWLTVLGIVLTFIAFGAMFLKISLKNVKRIAQLPESKLKVWNCMPLKSFAIMAFMIALGVFLRGSESVPRGFIAFFYIGLGSALALAGCAYIVKLFKRN